LRVTDPHELTAVEQAAALRAGELGAVELVEHALRRIERLDPTLAAFVTLTPERALDAAAELAKRGTGAAVLHVPTLKPLDREAIAQFAASVPHVLVAENHVSSGGLASQVAEVLYDAGIGTRMSRIGLPDKFIECGSVPTLQRRYGLTVDRMIDVALAVA